jgi:hypothetical protein
VPGIAVGLLALAATLMAVRTDNFTHAEKAVWVVICLVLCVVELKTIYRDRDQHDKQQAELQTQEDAARRVERNSFANLLNAEKALFSDTQNIETLAKKALENVTGGDSFAYVAPQRGYDQIPLIVWNHGDQVLSGVTITIAHTEEPNWGDAFYRPIFIGTIGPHDHAPIPNTFLSPKLDDKTGQDNYWIMISAQNGTVSQSLWFRKAKSGALPWACSFQVARPIYTHKRIKGEMTNVTTMKPLMYRAWSDEPAKPQQ